MLSTTVKSLLFIGLLQSAQSARKAEDLQDLAEPPSDGARCCCKDQLTARPNPEDLCVDPSSLQAFEQLTHARGKQVRKIEVVKSGPQCGWNSMCQSEVEVFSLKDYRQASNYGENKITVGDQIYELAATQGGQKCMQYKCSKHIPNSCMKQGKMVFGQHNCMMYCHSQEVCVRHENVGLCPDGLKYYVRASKVGRCVPEDELRKKWWVGYKTCPEGLHHKKCDCKGQCK
eukprot:TRINITY_DN110334_c0_g1_i1.p1 TRINITY_DN110334_c0_g1~~TRINITY_DN110334_c0_g1_i1.p1  ORF type:complete len:230 (-),score=33.98 TRINITY_DN110334_c0_g1_i1:100-789(-)